MANGKVSTNTTYDSYFWVKWSVESQDVATNKTKLNWSCGVYCGHSFYNNAIKMFAFTIDGVQVYAGGTYSNYSKGDHTIASGTLDVQHNEDGTKKLTISEFEGWLYSNHEYYSPGYAFDLPKIDRYAAITEASDFTDLDNPSIKFVYYAELEQPITDVWLEPNLAGERICVRTDIMNTGQYTWDLTDEERDTLRSKCSGNSCTVRIGIYSYIGDKRYSNYKDVKFTMTENDATKPNIVMDIKLNNGSLPSKFDDVYIQGKSKAEVKLTVSGKYGASIKSYSATVDGKEYANTQNFTSDVFQNLGNVTIEATATDSRGFSGEAAKTLSVSEYSKPLLVPADNSNAIMCYRSDGEGNKVSNSDYVWVKVKRHFSSIQQINTCAIQWRKKETSQAWNDTVHLWSDLLSKSADGTQYSGLIEGVTFANKKSYTIQLRAIDDLGEYDIKTFDVPTDVIALHLGKGGKSVSVGKYCDYSSEEPTFSSEWKAIFASDVVVGGDIFVGKNKTPLKDYILSVINEGG